MCSILLIPLFLFKYLHIKYIYYIDYAYINYEKQAKQLILYFMLNNMYVFCCENHFISANVYAEQKWNRKGIGSK